jgi:hypothetical protein
MSDSADQAQANAIERVGGALLDSALALPRLIDATLSQVVTAWEAVQAIPQIRDSLASIETDTRTMTDEVGAMRSGVDRLDGRVVGLIGTVEALGDRINEVNTVMRPLRRIGERLRGPVANGETPDVEGAIAEAALESPAEQPEQPRAGRRSSRARG